MPLYDTVNTVWEKEMNLPTTGWKLISYNGTSNAISRKYISVFNRSPYRVYVTTNSSADVADTRVIRQGGTKIFPYSDQVSLYGRSGGAGGARIIVTEECG